VRVPRSADDPRGYLTAVADALRRGRYDALLPTHEQAWLFAAGRRFLPDDTPLAVAAIDAFDQVEGKVDCAKLLDTVGLPQPAWSVITAASDLCQVQLPCWLKASFSTAGRGVRFVTSPNEAARALDQLLPAGPRLAQQPATGTYAQVAGLFAHGRLVAVHTSELVGIGAGGSAAARVSVDDAVARAHVEHLGRYLNWHGGLTLDYLHEDGSPQYIEANRGRSNRATPQPAALTCPG